MNRERRLMVMNVILWLLVVSGAVFYWLYYQFILTHLNLLISLIPAFVFFTAGVLVLNYNGQQVTHAKKNDAYTTTVELNWGQALKHDLLTYFLPVIILAMPLFLETSPDFGDFLSATIVFLALSYLKLLYWHRL